MGRYIIIKQVTSDSCIAMTEDPLDVNLKVYDSLEEAIQIASKQLYAKVYDLKWDYSNYLTLFNNYAKEVNKNKELSDILVKLKVHIV